MLRISTVWPEAPAAPTSAAGPDGARRAADVVAAAGLDLGAPEPTAGTGWAGLTWLTDAALPAGAGPQLRVRAGEQGIDLAVTTGALAEHGPALVVTDVDSTFITAESIDLLAARAGAGEAVAAVTELAMRGEIDFAESLRRRLLTLAGLPATVLEEVRAEIALMPGADALAAALAARGTPLGLVSGGFVEIVVPLAAELGIDRVRANALEVADGALTGRSSGAVVDAAAKARTLHAWAAELGVDPARVVAAGDGANDLPMLAAAGLGVAFCAKPLVQAQATAAVSFPRLDAVLGLVGLSAR
ncbi:phosphoserine phosphatase SerB [Georgenia faecalis]|uniref:phosphoserine phosphatase SerB n=1 Tax=Georgenia faecalis TaxID=2483799 RepID=UPI001F493143|nr:phosphoserine phosphatase SerB [Georgenia faecalis]